MTLFSPRYFISCLVGTLKLNGWEICGTVDLSRLGIFSCTFVAVIITSFSSSSFLRHTNDKSTFLLRQCPPQAQSHMCISLSKTNRIRLIVSSSDISEEAELQLTTKMNETIKQHWVALGPRNYGSN